jgi:hypothetical protein
VLELVKQSSRGARSGAGSPELDAEDDDNANNGTSSSSPKYYIASQEDLYQANEALQFIMPGFGRRVWAVWQLVSAVVCVLLSLATLPLFLFLNKSKVKR